MCHEIWVLFFTKVSDPLIQKIFCKVKSKELQVVKVYPITQVQF